MTLNDRRASLFENILRLRRAEQNLPPSRDLAAVRASLEQELGQTLSQRLAARLLGVSHTALQRWIDAGDLPTVFSERGRVEIPVGALLRLRETVDATRSEGTRGRHFLEPAMTSARARASQLVPEQLVSEDVRGTGHGRARRRNLAYHRAVAKRLRRPMVDEALRAIWKWRGLGRIDDRYADAWEVLLSRPIVEIKKAISEDSTQADDLRQNSPFAGALSEAERRKIVSSVE